MLRNFELFLAESKKVVALLTPLRKVTKLEMGITDRKLRQKEEVRTSILDTAWEIVVTEGWQSFSIRKVADAIEYSVPVIYSHFENKDAILQIGRAHV